VGQILERATRRLPAWARGRTAGRLLGAAVAVVLVVVLAVSCSGGAGGTVDVPIQSGATDAGVTGVRAPSTANGGTLRVVAATVDSLDPQRSYLPGV
jgi:peptide/nickel transport system substrate-binding protein